MKKMSLPPPRESELAGMKFLVVGLGRAGTAMAGFLLKRRAVVGGWDDNPAVFERPVLRRLLRSGLQSETAPAGRDYDWVVASPGVPTEHPVLRDFVRRGIPLVDELDMAAALLCAPIAAVTGTNGKSTTTALLAEMLAAGGYRVFCGGNLAPGRPLSAALGQSRRDWYVVEVSSFQLERSRWLAPKLALLLNISPDHLDRHRSFDSYAESKFRLFEHQTAADVAVLNRDDPTVSQAAKRVHARLIWFSVAGRGPGAHLAQGKMVLGDRAVARVTDVRLPGRHNLANALAAAAAADAVGVKPQAIRAALHSFRGLPHRLQVVRRLGGVVYVNNSMCTNPAAAVASLRAFDRKVVLIAGGRGKNLPLGDLIETIRNRARWTVLLGENREELGRRLEAVGYRRFDIVGTMAEAVRTARLRSRPGDVVLFSPGFASFDMFRDFAARGRAFCREVERV